MQHSHDAAVVYSLIACPTTTGGQRIVHQHAVVLHCLGKTSKATTGAHRLIKLSHCLQPEQLPTCRPWQAKTLQTPS